MEYRGIDFMVEKLSQALEPLLSEGGVWYIYGNEVDINDGKNPVLKRGDILTSEELAAIIAEKEKKQLICTYGTFGLFAAPEQVCKMVNYSQFQKCSCRVAVNVIDNWVVRVYVKDEAMLQRLFDYAKTVDPEAYLLTEEDDLGIGN